MPTTMESSASPPASAVGSSSPASVTSASSSAAISPLLNKLPLEVRRQIYRYVFAGSIMRVSGDEEGVPCGHGRCKSCRSLEEDSTDTSQHRDTVSTSSPNPGSTCSEPSILFRGPVNYRVLLTCQAIYQEARLILASSSKIYLCCISPAAAKQIICALKHDTFLRYAIPHVQSLKVLTKWQLDTVVPIFQSLASLQILKVNSWAYGLLGLELSAEEYTSPESDQTLIRWVERKMPRGQGMMKVFECLDRRFKVRVECRTLPRNAEDMDLIFVRACSF